MQFSRFDKWVLGTVSLICAVGAIVWYAERQNRRRFEGEPIYWVTRASGGFHLLAGALKHVLDATNCPTNYFELCRRYNETSLGEEWPLQTNGNPCPELLPQREYFWLRQWNRESDPPQTPLLWTYVSRYEGSVFTITIGGERRDWKSNDFVRMLVPLTNRIMRARAQPAPGPRDKRD